MGISKLNLEPNSFPRYRAKDLKQNKKVPFFLGLEGINSDLTAKVRGREYSGSGNISK